MLVWGMKILDIIFNRQEMYKKENRNWIKNIGLLKKTKTLYCNLKTEMLYKKRLLLKSIHHFKSDLINNMVHMRILGTQTSSLILS